MIASLHRPLALLLFVLAAATAAAQGTTTPTLAQQLPDFSELVERNAPAVVYVTARGENVDADSAYPFGDDEEVPEIFRRFFGPQPGRPQPPRERVSGGSGFIISADGFVLTNHHVVDGAAEVSVRLKDRREFTAKVVGSDPQSDVALLKLEGSGFPHVVLGNSNELKPGQWVVAIGSPFIFDYSVTAGVVSAVGRSFSNDQRYVPFIQTDVAINRGNSGGPLFNVKGEVVGINSQIFSANGGYMGLSFAIPIETARSVADQLRTKGKVSRGSLGVLIQEVTRDIADSLKLPRIAGALVTEVNPGSAAAKAGVKVQDVILAFNGRAIDRSSELPPLVGSTAPGQRATLTLFRDGKSFNLPVVVGELAGESLAGTAPQPAPTASANSLGLVVRALADDERAQLGLGAREGVLIERVVGAAARRAGLQPGDVVTMVGRQRVGSVAAFDEAVRAVPAGQAVMLLVRRGDASTFIAIRPETAP